MLDEEGEAPDNRKRSAGTFSFGKLVQLGRGRARADLGDTTRVLGGVADLGGRILKWAKTDEKL